MVRKARDSRRNVSIAISKNVREGQYLNKKIKFKKENKTFLEKNERMRKSIQKTSHKRRTDSSPKELYTKLKIAKSLING